jgi:hypothetical protein
MEAGGDEDLDEELADEPQADHAGRLAQAGLRPAEPMEGDGSDCGVGGVGVGDAGRNRHAQVLGDPVEFGVDGVEVAPTGHPLADGQLADALAHLHHHSAQRVPER